MNKTEDIIVKYYYNKKSLKEAKLKEYEAQKNNKINLTKQLQQEYIDILYEAT